MGILRNILENMKKAHQDRINQDDNETNDLYLRSLRRHRRKQMEEVEKQILVKQIKEYETNRASLLNQAKQEKAYMIKKRIEQKKNNISFFSRGNV